MAAFGCVWFLLLNFFLPAFTSEDLPNNAAPYSGAQVLIVKDIPPLNDILMEYELGIWREMGNYVEVMVPSSKLNVKSVLSQSSIPFSIKIQDLGKAIEAENPPITNRRLGSNTTPSFDRYLRLWEMHNYLDHLGQKYPQVASVGIMGFSAEGRALKYIKISSGKPNAKAVFIDGGIHAREWAAPASVMYIIYQLVENRQNLPSELLDVDFYILPVINPDGYEYTHTTDRLWRKNRSRNGRCFGADINRNFNFYFGGEGTSSNPCSSIYHGRGPNSELEAQALSHFLWRIGGDLKAYITFHSYGQYILVPYGYTRNAYPEDFDDMMRVAQEASVAMRRVDGAHYTVGHTANTLYPAAGGSDDWTKSQIGVKYVYTIELRDRGDHGFVLPTKYILSTAQEAFEAIKVIAKAASKA